MAPLPGAPADSFHGLLGTSLPSGWRRIVSEGVPAGWKWPGSSNRGHRRIRPDHPTVFQERRNRETARGDVRRRRAELQDHSSSDALLFASSLMAGEGPALTPVIAAPAAPAVPAAPGDQRGWRRDPDGTSGTRGARVGEKPSASTPDSIPMIAVSEEDSVPERPCASRS